MRKMNLLMSAALLVSAAFSFPAVASEDVIGEVATSGLIFKDSIEIDAFDDPTLLGIACYVTSPKKSLSLEDPTDSSIACRQVGPISGTPGPAKDIFSKSKNLFFKTMQVDRFYDAKRNVLVYISYVSSTSSKNHSHSVSVVPLNAR